MFVDFTMEELLYIEKIMDLNASAGEGRIRSNIEQFILAKAIKEDNFCKLLIDNINELAEAQIITKSIRRKIEEFRKEKK